jgi:hypothetical protein
MGVIATCGIYYIFWIYIIPRLRNYHIRQMVVELDDGAQAHKIVKVPEAEIEEWDRTHDAVGRSVTPLCPTEDKLDYDS